MRLTVLALVLCTGTGIGAFQTKEQPRQSEMQRAVDEFRIETRNLGLRTDSPKKIGAAKSPWLDWHGRLYENFRNDALDAVPHEIRQRGADKGLLRRNQFGFNVAGPLTIPHLLHPGKSTWFSLSYEGVRERISRTYLETIPIEAQRSGDYSQVVDPAGNLLPIYDPQTTAPNPNYDPTQPVSLTNLQYNRDPFPGNVIPTSRLDPVARKAASYYPLPNTDVGPFFRNNYFINSPQTNTANGMIAKLDQTIKDRHRLSVELAFSNGFLGAAHWFPTAANPGPSDHSFQTRRASVSHVFTASNHTVNTPSFDATSSASQTGDTGDPTDYPVELGLAGAGGLQFPEFQLPGYLNMGRSYPFSKNANNTFVWRDGVSTNRGKHTLRFTFSYTMYQVNTFWPRYPSGSLRFGAGLTSLPGIVDTGDPFASFLLGQAEYGERSVVLAPSYFRRTSGHVTFHDHWEARKGLIVSLNLACYRTTPRVEKYNRQSTVDLSAINPANGRPGALVAAALDGQGRSFQPVRYRLEPSLSVAWNPLGNSNTVVRAGFARSYGEIPIYTGQWGTQGFALYPTYLSSNVQLAPALTPGGGFPALSTIIPDLAPEAANYTVADLVDRSGRLPTYQSASLSVERELPGSAVLTAGVAYSGGKNLLVGNHAANPNAIPLSALSYRDQLNTETFNESLRPYPQYKAFDVYSSYPLGRYQRDTGYLRLEKRAGKGLSLSAYFEWSKQLDDYSGPYGTQDFYNRQNEWALTPGNMPERLTLTYVYELPFGNNKPFLNFPDWRKYVTDGWSLSGTANVAGGTPLYLRPEFNNTGGVVQALHVNYVPGVNPRVADQGPALWFNPAAFDQPPDFTIGDAPRTIPGLYNPGTQSYDLSLTKRFALSADRTLEFSAAGFDFLNHANWNYPDNMIGPDNAPNVNAGKIIGSTGGRVIQVGLRLSF